MKKPKRLINNGELSQIIVDVCAILFGIFLIAIIIGSELALKFKIIDTIFLFVVVAYCSNNLRGWVETLQKRKSSNVTETEESEDDL